MRSERGVTLIEVLVSVVLASILSTLSLQNFNYYRQSTFDAHAYHVIHNGQVSIEAGKVNVEDLFYDYVWASSDGDGNIAGWRVDEFAPGLTVEKNTRIYLAYDGWCDIEAVLWCGDPDVLCCIVDSIEAAHCSSETYHIYWRWNNGEVWEEQWENWPC